MIFGNVSSSVIWLLNIDADDADDNFNVGFDDGKDIDEVEEVAVERAELGELLDEKEEDEIDDDDEIAAAAAAAALSLVGSGGSCN